MLMRYYITIDEISKTEEKERAIRHANYIGGNLIFKLDIIGL